MFARILLITNTDDIKSAWLLEATSELRRRRHAVDVLTKGAFDLDALKIAVDTFSPTVVLWDIDTVHLCPDEMAVLDSHGFCTVCVTGGVAIDTDAPFPLIRWPFDFLDVEGLLDREVLDSAQLTCEDVSVDAFENPVLGVFQPLTDSRLSSVLSTLDALEGSSCVSFDQSWGSYYKSIHPYSNVRYWRHRVDFAVYFAGNDAPSAAQVLHQITCGSIVLLEEGVELGLSYLDDCPIFRFTPETLVALARSIATDSKIRSDSVRLQRRALSLTPCSAMSLLYSFAAIDHVRSSHGDAPIMRHNEPCRTFTIFGWFGAYNFGDDLLLRFSVYTLSQRYPNAQFRVIGADAGAVRREFGFMACSPDQKDSVRSFLEQSDALVFCGGLLFDDPLTMTAGVMEFCLDPWIEPTGQAAVCLLARTLGVPAVYLGAGAGPVNNIDTRRAVQLIGLSGAHFFLRDQHSCDLVRDCCVDEDHIGLYSDLILGSRNYIETSLSRVGALDSLRPSGDYFIVSLRDWHLNPPDFVHKVARALDTIVRKTGLVAVFLPFDCDDVSIHRSVSQAMVSNDQLFLDHRPDESRIFDLIGGSSFCVAMRLHCSILHHVLGKPAVGLDYNDKIKAHYDAMGQLDYLADLNIDEENLVALVEAVTSDEGALVDDIQSHVNEASQRVELAFDDLGRVISEARCDERYSPRSGNAVEYPRIAPQRLVDSTISMAEAMRRIDDLETRLADAETEVGRSQSQLQAISESSSFKLGSAIMWLPFKLKALLGRFAS